MPDSPLKYGMLYLYVPPKFSIFKYTVNGRLSNVPTLFQRVKQLKGVHQEMISKHFPALHQERVQCYEVAIATTDDRVVIARVAKVISSFITAYPGCNVLFTRRLLRPISLQCMYYDEDTQSLKPIT